MREKQIEQKFRLAVKESGGLALKLTCPGYAGMPDRMVLYPGGKIGFVEVKAPGQIPRLLQELRLDMLEELGFKAYVLDDMDMIQNIIDEIRGGDAN